jgi:hypothetical protein
VGVAQLAGLGWGPEKIAREGSAGRLHRLFRGAYAVGHPATTAEGEAMAAVLASGPGAVLSHISAAWLWGISTKLPLVPEVTTTRTVRHRRADLRLHSSRRILEADRETLHGIPVTAVPKTLLNVAGMREGHVRWALPRAKRLGLLDLIEIDEMLRRSRGMRGVARLRTALLRYRIKVFTRSDLELAFVALVQRAGVPQPSMNRWIAGYELDAYWADLRFAVELDTYDYHGDEISFEEDRLRQEDLKLAGIEMVRITGQRMESEPSRVVQRLRRLLDQRHAQLAHPGRVAGS